MSRRHAAQLPAARWRQVRRAAFERDGWRCRACGRVGRLEVDHILPLAKRGAPFDMANLQSLCRACHIAKSLRDYPPKYSIVLNDGWRKLVDSPLD